MLRFGQDVAASAGRVTVGISTSNATEQGHQRRSEHGSFPGRVDDHRARERRAEPEFLEEDQQDNTIPHIARQRIAAAEGDDATNVLESGRDRRGVA